MKYMMIGGCLFLSACCSQVQPGNGVEITDDGIVRVDIPSQQAPTIGDALDLTCARLELYLGPKDEKIEQGDLDEIIRRRVAIFGDAGKTCIRVPQYSATTIERHCEISSVRLIEDRNWTLSGQPWYVKLGEGLRHLFTFPFTGK